MIKYILIKICLNRRKLSVSSVSNISFEDPNFHWYSWFKMGMFYQYGLVYTCVRLTYNVSQTLIVFYVLYTLKMADNDVGKHTPIEVALVPLAIYVFSCLGSFYCEKFYIRFGRFLIIIKVFLFKILNFIKKIYLFDWCFYSGDFIIIYEC